MRSLEVNLTEVYYLFILTSKAEKRRQENIKNLKKKYIIEILHMEDVMENNARIEQMERQRKKQVFDKMIIEKERLAQIKREKEVAYLEKKKLQEQLQMEKEAILKEFELKKKRLARDRNSGNISIRDDINISPKFSFNNNKLTSGRLSPLEHTQSVNTSNFNNPSTPNLIYKKDTNPYDLNPVRSQSGKVALKPIGVISPDKDDMAKIMEDKATSQRSGVSNLRIKEPIPHESKFYGSPYVKKLPDRSKI